MEVLLTLLVATTEFDKLNLTVAKVTTGFNAVSTPKAYIKVVAEIDDSLKEAREKNAKKNSTNIKAMNNVKQKMKKITKQYEDLIAEYRKVKKKNAKKYMQDFLFIFVYFRIPKNS